MLLNAVYEAVRDALGWAKQKVDSGIEMALPFILPPAQFINELASVGTPVLALTRYRGFDPIPAIGTAAGVGAFCGSNTAITTLGYQIFSKLNKNKKAAAAETGSLLPTNSVEDSDKAKFPSWPWMSLSFISCVVTICQWIFNNIFLYGELKKAWFNEELNLMDALLAAVAYLVMQFIFDWNSDAVMGINGFFDELNFSGNLVEAMPEWMGVAFRSQFTRKVPRLLGSISQALSRMVPILVWLDRDTMSTEEFVGFNVMIALVVGLPVAAQSYLFEGQDVEDNLRILAREPAVEHVPTMHYRLGQALHITLYLGGPLDALDAFLGPWAFCLAIGELFDWPVNEDHWVKAAWGIGGIVGLVVGLNGAYIEVPEARKVIWAKTKTREDSHLTECLGCARLGDVSDNEQEQTSIMFLHEGNDSGYVPLASGEEGNAVISPTKASHPAADHSSEALLSGLHESIDTTQNQARKVSSVARSLGSSSVVNIAGLFTPRGRRSSIAWSTSSSGSSKGDDIQFNPSDWGPVTSPKPEPESKSNEF